MSRCSFVIILLAFLIGAAAGVSGAQTLPTNAQAIKHTVEDIQALHKVTVTDEQGKVSTGTIRTINWDRFEIDDGHDRDRMTFRYENVKDVTAGDGHNGFLERKIRNKQTLAVGAAIVTGALLLMILGR